MGPHIDRPTGTTMNTRPLLSLLTAATAVVALVAGLLLALNVPAPAADDFAGPRLDGAAPDPT
jgi:hypothetical protein